MTKTFDDPTCVQIKLRALPLKEMDGTLLAEAIVAEAPGEAEELRTAIRFAGFYHRNDTRASRAGLPRTHYIEHPLRVCLRLIRWGISDPVMLLAAILHDVVEDHADDLVGDYQRDPCVVIAGFFGEEVARVVSALTNPDPVPGASRRERDIAYVAHVSAAINDRDVLMVKFSDFADNALSLHHHLHLDGMVQRLARKYVPLVSVFDEALSSVLEGAGPLSEPAAKMLDALGKNRLAELSGA